jgi:hypothetical protein
MNKYPVTMEDYIGHLNVLSFSMFKNRTFDPKNPSYNAADERYYKACYHYKRMKELGIKKGSPWTSGKEYYKGLGCKNPEDAFTIWWDV